MANSGQVKFAAGYTATINASPQDIWAIWSDPAKWPGLDDGNLAADGGKSSFRSGGVVKLRLRSGQTVDVKLTEVREGTSFSDETDLGYGVVHTEHKLEQSGPNLIVSYTIEAQVDAGSVEDFTKDYWPNLLEGVPHQVHNVAALAKAA